MLTPCSRHLPYRKPSYTQRRIVLRVSKISRDPQDSSAATKCRRVAGFCPPRLKPGPGGVPGNRTSPQKERASAMIDGRCPSFCA
eukprot:s815_g2.t1